jgi:hypothetical protein
VRFSGDLKMGDSEMSGEEGGKFVGEEGGEFVGEAQARNSTEKIRVRRESFTIVGSFTIGRLEFIVKVFWSEHEKKNCDFMICLILILIVIL